MSGTGLENIIRKGLAEGVKSIFLFPGFPPMGNRRTLVKLDNNILSDSYIDGVLSDTASELQYKTFKKEKELDYSYAIDGLGRFRINAFLRMRNTGLVIRPVPDNIPSFQTLNLPPILKDFTKYKDGLVLITGVTGSGKSTTLAAMINSINMEKACHIITIEDPVEFVYKPEKSIISQREVGRDTKSFSGALKRVLREDPDVILVGEIRDAESMRAVMELAETGHLVLSTLHTMNVHQTINRIMDFFPDDQKNQFKSQISMTLRGIVSQMLLQKADGRGLVCACEIMMVNQSIRNLIKEDKIHQIQSVIGTSKKEGMITMDNALLDLYRKGIIDMPEIIDNSSKDRFFIEKVLTESPLKKVAQTENRMVDLDTEMVLYKADHNYTNLGYFNSSGTLWNTPEGLLLRDIGQIKDNYNFIADYTILNGRKTPFALKGVFSATYRILESKISKQSYYFKIRIVFNGKDEFEIPGAPEYLVRDGEWHTLIISIPSIHQGKELKYYMLLFDSDIREIIFKNIQFA